jgi:hypothetical protein
MHSNLSTTDGVSGILSSADVGLQIAELGKQTITGNVSTDEIANQLFQFGEMLKKSMPVAGTKLSLKKGFLWARKDSNLQPSGYEPRALPLSYGPGIKAIIT